MTRDETIRLEYTYLLQKAQGVETVYKMIEPLLKMLWNDIKGGYMTPERTDELRKWAAELQARTPEIMQHITAIEEEIKKLSAEEQVRMNFKG